MSGSLIPRERDTLSASVAVTSAEQHGGKIMSMQSSTQASTTPSASPSVNHLVLNVRDIERSHRFYTELLGFEQCGELTHTMTMRFYRGDASRHHDFALVQVNDPAATPAPDR